jgi:hypothetical protein
MTQYVAIFSREYRQYWTQDQMGYTDHPKDFGWWPTEEAKKLIAGIGQDKKLELVPYQPSRLQIILRQSRNLPPSG